MVTWSVLGKVLPVGQGRWIFPSTQHWWGYMRSISVLSSTRDTDILERVQQRATKMLKEEHLSYGKAWELTVQLWERKAQRGCEKNEDWLFSVVPSDRMGGNRHNLKEHNKFNMNIRKHFFIAWVSTGTDCPEKLWSHSPSISSKAWTWPWAFIFKCICLSRGLDHMDSEGPFQPQPFCHYVILWNIGVCEGDNFLMTNWIHIESNTHSTLKAFSTKTWCKSIFWKVFHHTNGLMLRLFHSAHTHLNNYQEPNFLSPYPKAAGRNSWLN